MSQQPMYRLHAFIGRSGSLRAQTNAYIAGGMKPMGAMTSSPLALRSGRNAAKWCVSGFNDLVLLTTKIGNCIGE